MMNITAKITEIKYKPFLCKKLNLFEFSDLEKALSKEATFILKINDNQIALSWWVSPKRTRSYPYARVYDSLSFSGKKVTIIPVMKDEGKDGDRDFLQWDTISLMSLLGVYVIIAYYKDAIKSPRYDKKITEQRFDIEYIKNQIKNLLSYQSDALHWNLSQINYIVEIGKKALKSYDNISNKLNVEMHSRESAEKRIAALMKGKESFMKFSRNLAELAQKRESITIQPKEKLKGIKGTITIKNFLGGNYYFTCDEVELDEENIYLIDAKHTAKSPLPSLEDIKDGLIKMLLFTNLKEVKLNNRIYDSIPTLKLTNNKLENINFLNNSQKMILNLLKEEAKENDFKISINDKFIV